MKQKTFLRHLTNVHGRGIYSRVQKIQEIPDSNIGLILFEGGQAHSLGGFYCNFQAANFEQKDKKKVKIDIFPTFVNAYFQKHNRNEHFSKLVKF